MFGASVVHQWYGFIMFGVMVYEPVFLLCTTRFFIAVVITAPNGRKMQILEGVTKYFAYGFGNQSLSPVGLTNPITNLAFSV